MAEQTTQKLGLKSFLIILLAAPLWIFLIVVLPQTPGFGGSPFRFLVTPIALTGITFAIQRLVRTLPDAWPISILIAPILAHAVLMFVALMMS